MARDGCPVLKIIKPDLFTRNSKLNSTRPQASAKNVEGIPTGVLPVFNRFGKNLSEF
jgi:hypothetical protein